MNHIKDQKSKAKKFWIVAMTLLGFVLANFSGPVLLLNTHHTKAMAILEGILRLTGNVILAVTISLSISAALRTKEDNKLPKSQVAIAAVLTLIALALAILSFKASTIFHNFDKYVEETTLSTKQDIINKLSKTEKIEKKSKLSRLYAQMTYEEDGKIIEYLTPEGKTATYTPSPDAIQNRDMLSFFRTYRKISPPLDIFIGAIWLLSIVAAVVIAVRKSRPKTESSTPNPPVDTDAA
jgi:hypothetical protein